MKAFLYPGQGSQKPGMGADLAQTPQGKAAFAQAAEVLGYDLREICVEGPGEELQRTLYTQPALYVVGAILTDLLADRGVRPGVVTGHSAGEYAALYAAGAFDFGVGLRIVGRRAQLMDEAGAKTGGTMAAVLGLEAEEVEKLISDFSGQGILGVAAYNADGQIVVSGERLLVEKAAEEAKKRGARMAKVLTVSGAFHSGLMKDASLVFAAFLEEIEFKTPQVGFVSNFTGRMEKNPGAIRTGLANLLTHPVRWTDCMKTLAAQRPEAWYELGPGGVLAGLVKRFDRSLQVAGIEDLASLESLK